MNLSKRTLVNVISENIEISKKDISAVIDAVIDTIVETVSNGDKVTIPGFGTFEARKRAARVGVNPMTGSKINIPAKTVPGFKAGKSFKETVNN